VLYCAFGKLSPLSIKLEINNGIRVAKPILNSFLKSHPIKIPSKVLGVFELEALSLGYLNDYLYAGATPVFIGPTHKDKNQF